MFRVGAGLTIVRTAILWKGRVMLVSLLHIVSCLNYDLLRQGIRQPWRRQELFFREICFLQIWRNVDAAFLAASPDHFARLVSYFTILVQKENGTDIKPVEVLLEIPLLELSLELLLT